MGKSKQNHRINAIELKIKNIIEPSKNNQHISPSLKLQAFS